MENISDSYVPFCKRLFVSLLRALSYLFTTGKRAEICSHSISIVSTSSTASHVYENIERNTVRLKRVFVIYKKFTTCRTSQMSVKRECSLKSLINHWLWNIFYRHFFLLRCTMKITPFVSKTCVDEPCKTLNFH